MDELTFNTLAPGKYGKYPTVIDLVTEIKENFPNIPLSEFVVSAAGMGGYMIVVKRVAK